MDDPRPPKSESLRVGFVMAINNMILDVGNSIFPTTKDQKVLKFQFRGRPSFSAATNLGVEMSQYMWVQEG